MRASIRLYSTDHHKATFPHPVFHRVGAGHRLGIGKERLPGLQVLKSSVLEQSNRPYTRKTEMETAFSVQMSTQST